MSFLKKTICVCLFLASILAYSQEEETEIIDEFHHHSVSILISHTSIFQGYKNGKRNIQSVPSWALDYNYSFNEKWSIGLHNDIILESFEVEELSDNKILERETPITTVIVGTYEIFEGFGIELGAGMEFDKNESFGLVRIGAEYGIEIPKHNLEFLLGIDYDVAIDAYDSFNIGFGLAKRF